MYTMGVDVGSASSKVVILEDGERIVAAEVVQVGTGSSGPQRALEQAYEKSGLTRADITKLVATGYGRFAFEDADKQISEISCHAKGIFHLVPTARTIIDIGGQDAKAIRLDNRCGVKQFFMNDKCAASTGFAESEVISQLSKGVDKNSIIKGVHQSVASKACGLAYRGGLEDAVVMTGGVAKNAGVVRAVARELKKEVIVAPNPQTTGALGAALFAYEEAKKQKN